MSTPRFTEKDVTKAIRAAVAAGLTVTRVDVDRHTGFISIITGAAPPPAPPSPQDEIAGWLEENDGSKSRRRTPRKG